MLSLDQVGEERLADWKADVDLGDHVCVERRGHHVAARRAVACSPTRGRIAAKTLRPLPVEHKPLAEETRVRQRYVDLDRAPGGARRWRGCARRVVRVAARVASTRAATSRSRRRCCRRCTAVPPRGRSSRTRTRSTSTSSCASRPSCSSSAASSAASSGSSRSTATSATRAPTPRTRPSSRCSSSTRPTPTTDVMATLTRELIQEAAMAACGSLRSRAHDGGPARPVRRVGRRSASIESLSDGGRPRDHAGHADRGAARAVRGGGHRARPDTASHGKLVEELFEHHVVAARSPARRSSWTTPSTPRRWCARTASKPGVVEKWDLYIDGFELGTGYSELVDPVIQRERLVEQSPLAGRRRRRGDAARRGLPARARVRHAADRAAWAWASTGCSWRSPGSEHPRDDPVPAGEAGMSAAPADRLVDPAGAHRRRARDPPPRRRLLAATAGCCPRRRSRCTRTSRSSSSPSSTARSSAAAPCTCMWEDLAEVRTLAVDPALRGQGVGHALLHAAARAGARARRASGCSA